MHINHIVEKISLYLDMDQPFRSIMNPANDLLRHARAGLLEQEARIRKAEEERDMAQHMLIEHAGGHEKTTMAQEWW